MPTRRHEFPAIRVESRQPLRPQALSYGRPKLLLVLTGVKCSREFRIVGADVPEEDSKGVDVYCVVVGTGEKFGGHVNGRADDSTSHHSLRFAETEIRECTSVLIVKL